VVIRGTLLAVLLASVEAVAQSLPPPIQLELPEIQGAAEVTLLDRRPPEERATREERVFNLWIVTLGDEMLRPGPAEAMRAWLRTRLAAQLQGREVVLESLRAELELQSTSVDFQGAAVQGAGFGANLLGNLIAKVIIEGVAAGRTDNVFRFRARGSVGGAPFRADLRQRYRGSGFGSDIVEAFSAGFQEVAAAIERALVPPPDPAAP